MHELFFEIHNDLPREGPGCNSSTREAFSKIDNIPQGVQLLDIGCGPGIQTIELASLLLAYDGEVTAVDINQPYLDSLLLKISENSISNIKCEIANMFEMQTYEDSFDIVWAEGAVFIIGFEKGLLEWRNILKEKGDLVVSELSWLKSGAPAEATEYWSQSYPAMNSIEENIKLAKKCGYSMIGHITLPAHGWTTDYYAPLESRIEMLRPKYRDNKEAIQVLDDSMVEIDMFRKYSEYYSYEFYILKKEQA